MGVLGSLGQLYMFILLVLLFAGSGFALWSFIGYLTKSNTSKTKSASKQIDINKNKERKILGGIRMKNNGWFKLATFSFVGILISMLVLGVMTTNGAQGNMNNNMQMQGNVPMQNNMNGNTQMQGNMPVQYNMNGNAQMQGNMPMQNNAQMQGNMPMQNNAQMQGNMPMQNNAQMQGNMPAQYNMNGNAQMSNDPTTMMMQQLNQMQQQLNQMQQQMNNSGSGSMPSGGASMPAPAGGGMGMM